MGPDGFPAQEVQPAEQSAFSSAGAPAGFITNRPPEKTNAGGEDWLEVSLYISYRNFDALVKTLNAARLAAENCDEGNDVVLFGGVKFLVRPAGAAAGEGSKQIYFRWQLRAENGILIQLMDREQPHHTMPNGNVRMTSLLLMELGAERAWALAQDFLRAIGCNVERNKLSRVDACVDLPEVNIEWLCNPYLAGHYVTRALGSRVFHQEDHVVESGSCVHSFGRTPTGFVVGQDSLKVRVYDKYRESNRMMEKIRAVASYRWGYLTCIASRVEFQLRRDALKDVGVDTVEDWFEMRSDICAYLCTKWFRLTTGPVDRNHADRSETLPEWIAVERAFAEWTGSPKYIELQALASEESLPSKLVQQALGLFVSYFARTYTTVESNTIFVGEATRRLLDAIGPRDMASEVERRALELGLVATPFKEFESE